MIGVALAMVAATGTYLVYTAAVLGWRGVGPMARRDERRRGVRARAAGWLTQAGLDEVPVREFVGVVVALVGLGTAVGWTLFGTAGPAVSIGAVAGATPIAGYRRRRDLRRVAAQEAWPRLIDEIRILTSSAGRSIPQALFEAGRNAPVELRGAFDAAQREWVLSTDLARTLDVLKDRLADPTADATCETLLVAHEIGGTDLDRRLEALGEDRRQDAQGRKDARARQAGVRFARAFTIVVPAGMAGVGLTIGDGRAAYQSPTGQAVVLVALAMVGACWLWASRILRLPEERRVFGR